jgi:hypothetical protein
MLPSKFCYLFFSFLFLSIVRDVCFTSALSTRSNKKRSVLPQDKILKSLTYYKLDKALSQDLIDLAETAVQSWSNQPSVFLSQPEQKAVTEAFKDLVGLKVDFAGGFPGAENCRAIFQRSEETAIDYNEKEDSSADQSFNVDEYIAVLNIEGNFIFEKATYDDFKSAMSNTLGGDKGEVLQVAFFISSDYLPSFYKSSTVPNTIRLEISFLLGIVALKF